jgi:phosphate transport system substrate-binding protein
MAHSGLIAFTKPLKNKKVRNNLKRSLPYIFFLSFFIISCNSEEKQQTMLTGDLKVIADESFLPLINSEIKIFEYQYKQTKVNASALPEGEAIQQLMEGKADQIIISRELNKEEKRKLKKENVFPDSYKIAYDALVFIVNRERQDSIINIEQLKNIFEGKIGSWTDLSPASEGGEIMLAFDQSNSSNLLYINDRFKLNIDSINIFAAGSNLKVIEYVKANKNALGVISLGWISDDPATSEQLKSIKVLSVSEKDNIVYSPFQEDLGNNKYPFKRDIYLVNKYKTGLGTGFASFVLSDDGQRIVLKAGLLPVKMPGREIIIK